MNEADEYSGSLPGISLDVVRTGLGYGPNVVRSLVAENITLAAVSVQFPVFGHTTVAGDVVIVALVSSAPPSTRWCGIDLKNGSMLLYGPGTQHTGVSPAGVSFSFAAIGIGMLEEAAERREITLNVPDRGRVVALDPKPEALFLGRLLRSCDDPVFTVDPLRRNEDVLYAMGAVLAGSPASQRATRRVADSRGLVKACIDNFDAIWESSVARGIARRPTVHDLCEAVHVSERRLRNAFYDTFGIAPLRYFRLRAMTRARGVLVAPGQHEYDPGIALDLGYNHLARFAAYYKDVFGEYPKETVAST